MDCDRSGFSLLCLGFFLALGPIFAAEVLQGGPNTFGFLMTASSVGTLIGGVYLSRRPHMFGFEKVLVFGPVLMGVSLIVFALSHVLWLSLIALLGGWCRIYSANHFGSHGTPVTGYR